MEKEAKLRSKYSWVWLQGGELKKEAESLIVAVQYQCIRTKLIKTKTDKSQNNPMYRLRKSASESIDPIVSGCSKLAQKEYKGRYDNMD